MRSPPPPCACGRADRGQLVRRSCLRPASSPHQRDVAALYRACLQLTGQDGLGFERACNHHQPGRFLVEPMHDTRTRQAGGGIAVPVQQAVEQRAAPVARSRVHDHARGLVDDNERVVFVDDLEGTGSGVNASCSGSRSGISVIVAPSGTGCRIFAGAPSTCTRCASIQVCRRLRENSGTSAP